MKPKRRNLTRWQTSRLRRLRAKMAGDPLGIGSLYGDYSPDSLKRCASRAAELSRELRVDGTAREVVRNVLDSM